MYFTSTDSPQVLISLSVLLAVRNAQLGRHIKVLAEDGQHDCENVRKCDDKLPREVAGCTDGLNVDRDGVGKTKSKSPQHGAQGRPVAQEADGEGDPKHNAVRCIIQENQLYREAISLWRENIRPVRQSFFFTKIMSLWCCTFLRELSILTKQEIISEVIPDVLSIIFLYMICPLLFPNYFLVGG